jgi:RNA polymerase sigma-70 factor (ECF subfamily)
MAEMDLEEIFRAHQREVFAFLLRTVGNHTAAEDLAQDVFVRAFRSSLLFRGESSIRTWLFTIANRVLIDHYRKKQPEQLTADLDPGVSHDPAEKIALEETLLELPLLLREAVVLCDVLGFSPAEAASVCATSSSAFRVRLHRGRNRFKEVFEYGNK